MTEIPVHDDRNRCSRSPKRVFTSLRNKRSPSTETTVHHGPKYAWGLGVQDDGILDRQMENLLGLDYDVINTGIPGYAPDQEILYYIERGAAFQAATVILFLFTENASLPPSGTSIRNRSSCSFRRVFSALGWSSGTSRCRDRPASNPVVGVWPRR